jgi:plasmid stability protein
MAQLQVPIPDELLVKLKVKALITGRTLTAFVNQVLTKAVAK